MSQLCPRCRWPVDQSILPLIWVPGKPISWGLGKGRAGPRVAPAAMKDWKKAIWAAFRQFHRRTLDGPVELTLYFDPESSRQDLTNLVKAAEDGLKTHAFGDDCLVYRTVAMKQPSMSRGSGMAFRVDPYHGPAFPQHIGRGASARNTRPPTCEEAEAGVDGPREKHSRVGEASPARLSPQERCPEERGPGTPGLAPRPFSKE